MRKLWYACALAGVALISSGLTLAVRPARVVVVVAPPPAAHHGAAHTVTRRVVPHAPARRGRQPRPVRVQHLAAVTPSLYERTTAPPILRAQGCRAARVGTSGLVVLDFGKQAFRPRRGGYGTVTFANRFASHLSLGWAVRSYARGYSECLGSRSRAHITLALGTSNYDQDVPSTYVAGRLWARATVRIGAYVARHHFDHVTVAAADDVEPAWDRGFRRTYDFFRGFESVKTKYLLYNYGSLDGGHIWKLRQAFYVAGGMHAARVVPEIYNREMAEQWAELSRLAVRRYGRPIRIAGLMTQHRGRCRGCGFTAAQAHTALMRALSRHPRTKIRRLEARTNIGEPAPVTAAELGRRFG
jgi:hypothetical protein